jgi:hypothetical protein
MFPLHRSELSSCYLGIDVGPEKSGFALFHKVTGEIAGCVCNNSEILNQNSNIIPWFNSVIIEYPDRVQPRVGNEFIKMVFEAGRFYQLYKTKNIVHQLGRSFVQKKLGKNDSAIRSTLIKKYGKEACKELKKDSWQAFGLIHCWINE